MKQQSFEGAFKRLEEILEKMNEAGIELEEAIRLYEEADSLIGHCSDKLGQAEQKIELLIKKRSGELEIGADGTPAAEPFERASL